MKRRERRALEREQNRVLKKEQRSEQAESGSSQGLNKNKKAKKQPKIKKRRFVTPYTCLLMFCIMFTLTYSKEFFEGSSQATWSAWCITGVLFLLGMYVWFKDRKRPPKKRKIRYTLAVILISGISVFVITKVLMMVGTREITLKTVANNKELFSLTEAWVPKTAISESECGRIRQLQDNMLKSWKGPVYPIMAHLAMANESVMYRGGCDNAWKPLYIFFENLSEEKQRKNTLRQERVNQHIQTFWPKHADGCEYIKERITVTGESISCTDAPETDNGRDYWLPPEDKIPEEKVSEDKKNMSGAEKEKEKE